MFNDVHFSSGKDDWATPRGLFEQYNKIYNFDLDVCATAGNKKCEIFISPEQDSLKQDWHKLGKVGWCNPPYSRGQQSKFITKADGERLKGFTTVCLIPARTDTKMFHNYIWDKKQNKPREGVIVEFLEGRIKFEGAAHGAPFPSMIVVFIGTQE